MDIPVLGSYVEEKASPLGWLECRWGSLDSAHEEHTCGLALEAGWRGVCPTCCQVSQKHLATSHSFHATVQQWTWGIHNWGKHSTMGHKGDLVPGQSLGRVVVVIAGVYSSGISETAQSLMVAPSPQLTA